MAALLRQGARRVGGAVLQRTQAALTSPAVAEERRRLVTRRMLSTEKHIPEAIKKKEEELYAVLTKAENLRDMVLLGDLVEHINPRPHEKQWRWLRFGRKIRNFAETFGTAVFLSLGVVVSTVNGIYDAAERRVAMERESQVKK